MKTYAKRWWHLRWWTDRLVRHRIRAFVRRCSQEGVFKWPVLDAGSGYRSSRLEVFSGKKSYKNSMGVMFSMERPLYQTLDSNPDLKPHHVGNICNMDMIESESFGSVICTEVLEHVEDPSGAMYEMHRVLRPGGTVVITVPFYYPIHQKPYQKDYWRFTPDGLRVLLTDAGFHDITITKGGRKLKPSGVFAHAVK